MPTGESSEPALAAPATVPPGREVRASGETSISQPKPRHPTVREKSAPINLLDLIDRLLVRATSSWQAVLMHLALVATVFVGLAAVGHLLTGVSPWTVGLTVLGGGVGAGGTAYRRHRRQLAATFRNDETTAETGHPEPKAQDHTTNS
jgi:hypothetical protein